MAKSSVSAGQRRRRAIFFIVLAVVVALGIAFGTSLAQLARLRAEYRDLQEQDKQADLEISILEQELEYAQTDNFIRRMARELLGWVEPGDTKIVDGSGD